MPKPHKYGAVRTTSRDGIEHPSGKQARRWETLCMLSRGGAITGLQREVTIPLVGRDGPLRSATGRALSYRADFVYVEKGETIYEDTKGYETPEFKIKRAILAAQGVRLRLT